MIMHIGDERTDELRGYRYLLGFLSPVDLPNPMRVHFGGQPIQLHNGMLGRLGQRNNQTLLL